MTQFTAHGQFDIRCQGQWLYTSMLGVWNREATQSYAIDVQNSAQDIYTKPWLRIVDLEHFEGGGQEVTDELVKLQSWSKQHNCIYVIFILPQRLVEFMLSTADEVYRPFEIVQSFEQAENLAQQIIPQNKITTQSGS